MRKPVTSFVLADALIWQPPPDVELIICDPPYGTGKIFPGRRGLPDLDDRSIELSDAIMRRVISFGKPAVIFGEWTALRRVPCEPDDVIFWASSWISGFKTNSHLPRQVDVLMVFHANVRNIIQRDGRVLSNLWADCPSVLHKSFAAKTGVPTEKCEEVGARIAECFSNPGALIADLCCGGGSLGRGALSVGRRVVFVDSCAEYLAVCRSGPSRVKGSESRGWHQDVVR